MASFVNRRLIILLVCGLAGVVVVGWWIHSTTHATPRVSAVPGADKTIAEPWKAAIQGHSEFVAQSKGLSPAERKAALQHQADELSKVLSVTPSLVADDIRERLLGIYGSLGDWKSARVMNLELLAHASESERPDLEKNLAEIEYALVDPKAKDTDQIHTALTQTDKALQAAKADNGHDNIKQMLSLFEQKASLQVLLKKGKDAAETLQSAIDYLTVREKDAPEAREELGGVLFDAIDTTADAEDPTIAQRFLAQLKALSDKEYTYAKGFLSLHEIRNDFTDDHFISEAEEILHQPITLDTAMVRMALAMKSYVPKGDHLAAAQHLQLLLDRHELQYAYDKMPAAERKNFMNNNLPKIYDQLASSLQELGEKEQAQDYYVKLIAEYPAHPYAKHAQMVLDNGSK